jgi:hypothetical protein
MQLSTYRRIVPLVAGLLLVVAACGGGSDSGSGGSGGTKSFTVGFTSAGMSSAPFLAALDQLRGQGYKIQTPELAESELVTEGVAKGRFAFGSGANNEVMTADTKGADLKWEALARIWDVSFFPPLSAVLVRFWHMTADGEILGSLGNSLVNLAIGFAVSVVVGVGVGLLMGAYRKVTRRSTCTCTRC